MLEPNGQKVELLQQLKKDVPVLSTTLNPLELQLKTISDLEKAEERLKKTIAKRIIPGVPTKSGERMVSFDGKRYVSEYSEALPVLNLVKQFQDFSNPSTLFNGLTTVGAWTSTQNVINNVVNDAVSAGKLLTDALGQFASTTPDRNGVLDLKSGLFKGLTDADVLSSFPAAIGTNPAHPLRRGVPAAAVDLATIRERDLVFSAENVEGKFSLSDAEINLITALAVNTRYLDLIPIMASLKKLPASVEVNRAITALQAVITAKVAIGGDAITNHGDAAMNHANTAALGVTALAAIQNLGDMDKIKADANVNAYRNLRDVMLLTKKVKLAPMFGGAGGVTTPIADDLLNEAAATLLTTMKGENEEYVKLVGNDATVLEIIKLSLRESYLAVGGVVGDAAAGAALNVTIGDALGLLRTKFESRQTENFYELTLNGNGEFTKSGTAATLSPAQVSALKASKDPFSLNPEITEAKAKFRKISDETVGKLSQDATSGLSPREIQRLQKELKEESKGKAWDIAVKGVQSSSLQISH